MQHERRSSLKIILILFLTLCIFCFIFKLNHSIKTINLQIPLIFIFFNIIFKLIDIILTSNVI